MRAAGIFFEKTKRISCTTKIFSLHLRCNLFNIDKVKQLTEKEEILMRQFWERGPLFVREIVDAWPEPKPHFNTVSTFVRILEEKGFVGHESFGKSYRYHALVSEDDYNRQSVKSVIKKLFNNSAAKLVSTLVEEEDISLEEIEDIINQIKQRR